MGFCDTCHQAKNIPDCVTTLNISGLANTTTYDAYVKHVGTGRVETIEGVTTDGSGDLALDVSGLVWQVDQVYEIWFADPTANAAFDKQDITIGATTKDCITFKIVPVYADQNTLESYAEQNVTV